LAEDAVLASRRDFEALLDPLLDPLFGAALRLTRNRAEAEDVLQESVMKAWRSFDRFQRGTNFKAWMFKILTNTFVSRKRSEAHAPRAADLVDVQDVAEALHEEAYEPEVWERVYPKLVDDDMKRALDDLPAEFRAPFLLSTLGGLSYKEMAEALDVPVGTIMSRIFRARARLRRQLKQYAEARRIPTDGKAGGTATETTTGIDEKPMKPEGSGSAEES
jgi:RNA polymerase sigma-70 factor (ECF subfamily)